VPWPFTKQRHPKFAPDQEPAPQPSSAEDQPASSVAAQLATDEPIQSASQDLLGRAPFAAAVARTVERAPRGSGFVIAVTGLWGDGKTSVLNMAVEQLEARHSVEVVHFNPWLFSGAEDLLARFFAEVAAQLPKEGPTRAVSSGLRRYAGAVAPFKSLPWLGGVLQTTGELAHGAASLLAPDAASAYERARELRAALAQLERPILIVVDDIDRLRSDEIADVMRLVRLVGDFPNLTYLLAFDRERVEEALGGSPERRSIGADYLEKIVQAIFEMPAVRQQAREGVLQQALNEALGDLSRLTFSQDAFANVYAHGLRELFGSVRDVRRVANALPAAVELVGDEIEIGDVVTLEALRLLEPEVYAVITDHPEAFTAARDLGIHADREADERHRLAVDSALRAARRQQPVRDLLHELFPAVRRFMGGSNYGSSWEATWRRERRVASMEVLEIYLARGLEPGAIAQSLIRAIMTALDDRATLDRLFESLDGEAVERLANRLEDYDGQFETEHPEHLIGALLDRSGAMRTGRRGIYDMGADMALSRALLRILRNRDAEAVRCAVSAVRTESLWGHYELVLLVGHVEGAGHKLVSEENAKRLERALSKEVLAASSERLARERELAAILRMAHWSEPDALRAQLDDWLREPRFVRSLLDSAVLEGFGHTFGRAGLRRTYQLGWRGLTDMASEERLARAVGEAAPWFEAQMLSERERAALDQALRYAEDPDAAAHDLDRWGESMRED
jgi:predicted KAP-like P-loop ATPase